MRACPLLALALLVCPACADSAPRPAAAEPVNLVQVTTYDYGFELPDTLPAGPRTFLMVNDGPEYHHMQIFRIEGGHGVAEAVAALAASHAAPDWLVAVGGPEGHDVIGEAVRTTVLLEPGEYLVTCMIASPDGQRHHQRGMARRLTVVPGPGETAELPPADLVLTLRDFSFDLSAAIQPGRQVIRVVNEGPLDHHVGFARLREGMGLADVLTYDPELAEPWPAEVVGGTSGLAPGQSNLVEIDFEPGEYVLLCFVPHVRDGKPHVEHGMARQISVR